MAGGSDPASEEGGGVRADWAAEERVVGEAATGIPQMRTGRRSTWLGRVDRRSSDLVVARIVEGIGAGEYGGGAIVTCGIRSWGLDFFFMIDWWGS